MSVLAEKMQTFLSKGVLNSRAKDLYDMYVLEKTVDESAGDLKIAFAKTCEKRGYEVDKETALKILSQVETSPQQRDRWAIYSNKAQYAKGIDFDDAMSSIGKLIERVF